MDFYENLPCVCINEEKILPFIKKNISNSGSALRIRHFIAVFAANWLSIQNGGGRSSQKRFRSTGDLIITFYDLLNIISKANIVVSF